MLSNVPKNVNRCTRARTHTLAEARAHTNPFPCAAFILQHHNATLNMVRTSFLKLIKAVKLYCSLLKQMPGEEPRDDTSTHPPPLRLSFFFSFLRRCRRPTFRSRPPAAVVAAMNNLLAKCLIRQYANVALMHKEGVESDTNAE